MSRARKLTDEERKQHQAKSRDKWNSNNKSKAYRYQKKSRAKNFLLKDATIEELNYFSELISKRLKELQNNNSKKD